MFLHRSYFIQREAKWIYHKRDLICIQAINLVEFNRDNEEYEQDQEAASGDAIT